MSPSALRAATKMQEAFFERRATKGSFLAIPNPDPSGLGYYGVYSDQPRGGVGYCGYHSYGSCNGVNVQFAFFFNLDGDSGCDPQDMSGLHSQGLAAIAKDSRSNYRSVFVPR